MNPQSRELFRVALLQQLAAVAPQSLPVPTLLTGVRLAGFPNATEEEAKAELDYLGDKNLVVIAPQTLSPENKRWKIRAEGRDLLAVQGLA